MNDETIVTGVVAKSTPVGENDRVLELITKERGRITVFARGCRRPRSRLVAYTRPFCFAEFTIICGSSNHLQDAKAINFFEDLPLDYEAYIYASYFMEFACYFVLEEMESTDVLNLLFLALKALTAKNKMPRKLVRFAFEMRMLVLGGFGPYIHECIECGKACEEGWFYHSRGGLVCKECRGADTGGVYLGKTELFTLRYVCAAPLKELFGFTLSPEVEARVLEFCEAYKRRNIERRPGQFPSLDELNRMGPMP
jgi:DNA repair protein RecO (recombination protein O)